MTSGCLRGFALQALSKRNEDPAGASRPWDKNRDGFVMGEGAGEVLVAQGIIALPANRLP